MRVRVAIDLALDRLFDYEVPEALRKKLAVGQLLSVPFGHRTALGYAMEVADDAAAAARSPTGREYVLKPVGAIVDEVPFFSPTLLTLVRRLAEYSAAPLESVLKAAVPAAVRNRQVHARQRLFVEAAETLSSDIRLTARQRWVYDQLVRLGGGYQSSLVSELGVTAAMFRTLAEKGAAVIAPRECRRSPLALGRILPSRPLPLNAEQAAALAAIGEDDRRAVLLHGITGSGKTEVYLQAIAACLAEGKSAIVMVPEIALTPQTVSRFASRFGSAVAVLHSALSDGERYDEWHRIRAGEARVVVGPRSAVFAPVRDLGLIVVDEEHEPSYKQDDSPRYHARDAAVWRGALEGARVVLGSATPSLESYLNARRGKYRLVRMTHRAGKGSLPRVAMVEMGGAGAENEGGLIFSRELIDALKTRLDRGEQSILFLNRRGFSRSVVCEQCGYVFACPDCSTAEAALPYTYHRADRCLRCHVCGSWTDVPSHCPACGGVKIAFRGIGTQRVEAALGRFFPSARVIRMDADSTSRRHTHDELLGAFRRGEADILLGTQMIAKGLDFPNVTLVGVLNADSSLNLPDFRAGERTFQLLSQVAGRAGRSELPGEVIVQTGNAAHPVLKAVLRGSFDDFAAAELRDRKEGGFPPYCHLAVVILESKLGSELERWAQMYSSSLMAYARQVNRTLATGMFQFHVSAAFPSAIEMAAGRHRWQIVMRAGSTAAMVGAWRWIIQKRPPPKFLKLAIDIDARNLV